VTRVVLHRLSSTKRALDASRLIESLVAKGKRVLVYFSDAERATTFDQYLWTYSQSSFVGHSLWDGHSELDDPVVLVIGTLERPNGAAVLVTVDPLPDLAEASVFDEVHDFVTPLPEDQDKPQRWSAAGFQME
jgi:DNA polymerase IIIc chi subunit